MSEGESEGEREGKIGEGIGREGRRGVDSAMSNEQVAGSVACITRNTAIID